MKTLRAYAELIRLPNAFTAAADAVAGSWLACAWQIGAAPADGRTPWETVVGWPRMAWLIVASVCLYSAGIVLNDLRDLDADRRERPTRPLPPGRVTVGTACLFAAALAVLGILAAAFAGSTSATHLEFTATNHGLLVALALVAAIALYDLVLKETPLGPLAMGLCRALNLALPLAATGVLILEAHVAALAAMFVYVASFTHFGREEVGPRSRARLWLGTIGITVGLFLLGPVAMWNPSNSPATFVLWLALLVHMARVGWRAARQPAPATVQYAMKTFILGIVVLDAVLACAVGGPVAGGIVLALLIPPLAIGRRLYST